MIGKSNLRSEEKTPIELNLSDILLQLGIPLENWQKHLLEDSSTEQASSSDVPLEQKR